MAELTIQESASITDSWFDDVAPDTNRGTSVFLNVGEEPATTRTYRTLIKFDLSGVPADATISAAVLSLKLKTDYSSNTRTYRIYRVLRAWNVSQATWNVYTTGNGWGTAGCANTTTDREATDIGSASIAHDATVDTWVNFTLTAASVQAMITGGAFTNNGFLIKADTETDDLWQFYSADNGTEGNNPKLVITYTTPVTAKGAAFLALL